MYVIFSHFVLDFTDVECIYYFDQYSIINIMGKSKTIFIALINYCFSPTIFQE